MGVLSDPYDPHPILTPFLYILTLMVTPVIFLITFLSDHLMSSLFNAYYIYNVSWEDPHVESTLLGLGKDDHVLTIASAGDNALHYALLGAKVTAVDLNHCQLSLVHLKLAAALALPYTHYFAIFGECDGQALREHYPRIRGHLPEDHQAYWDSKVHAIGNLMYSGSSGMLAWFLFRVLFPVFGMGWMRQAIVDNVSSDAFREMVMAHANRIRTMTWTVDTLLTRLGLAMAGVPEKQFALGANRTNTFAQVAQKILLDNDFMGRNYFFQGYILGHYTKNVCPEYLKEENYARLREVARSQRLQLLHCTVADACATKPSTPFTLFSSLDHYDWLEHAHINHELTVVYPVMAQGATIFYRTFSDVVHSPVLQWLDPQRVDDTGDRVPMYFSCYTITVDHARAPQPRCESWDAELAAPQLVGHASQPKTATAFSTSTLQKVATAYQIVTFPIKKMFASSQSHATLIDTFYATQASSYDSFRERFLWARSPLISCLPIFEQDLVWIDIGGGTGRNLEFVPRDVIARCFRKIIVVDISQSLLNVANKRCAGIDNIETICADILDEKTVAALPKADIVTFSYSLSMIPDRRAAIRHAMSLLKEGGCLGIADFSFTGTSKQPSLLRRLERFLQAAWFRQDGVHLLTDDDLSSDHILHQEKFRELLVGRNCAAGRQGAVARTKRATGGQKGRSRVGARHGTSTMLHCITLAFTSIVDLGCASCVAGLAAALMLPGVPDVCLCDLD